MASKQLVADILSGVSPKLSRELRDMPLANKILELEKAIVEPKKSDTPTLLHIVIKQLVDQGAIYPDEASAVYGRLLSRLVKFNSLRNHNNLAGFVEDIQQGQRSAVLAKLQNVPAMSNMIVLQNFLNLLPKTVSSGQQNYDAFKQLLKQFVIEYNQYLEVYKSGTDTFLQYNFGPSVQKVNLSQAFNNLSGLWGAKITSEDSIPSLTSLLQPQSRFLILLLSPIAMEGAFIRDSFLAYLVTLYKNTVVPPMKGQPVQELGNVIASLGPSYDQLKLRQGLNYLVTNQQQEYRPEVPEMTKEEEAILRYVQTLLRTKIAGGRKLSEVDLDNVLQNLSPIAFSGQIDFVNKLFDYFRKVLKARPTLMTDIIYDKQWRPPPAFYVKNVWLPADLTPVPAPRTVVSYVDEPPRQDAVSRSAPPPRQEVVPRPIPPARVTSKLPAPKPRVSLPPLPISRPRFNLTQSKFSLPSTSRLALPSSTSSDEDKQVALRSSYRAPTSVYSTEESDLDSDYDIPNPRNKKRNRVLVDVHNLTSAFSKLKGQGYGLDSLILKDVRQRARNVNIRPY
ncbi:pIIIa [Siadenovirus carbocapituli]|uniref:PIIIa n=1 Tax=Siadenovirus sp. TaxID=2671519 RepID=A0A9E7QWX3_9ADEN|nr:pIIIa [Siadenovirus sp.]